MNKISRKIYPCVTISKTIILPTEKISLVLEGKEAVDAVRVAGSDERHIVLLFQKNGEKSKVAVLAQVIQFWYMTPVVIGFAVEGLSRVRVLRNIYEDEINKAEIEVIEEIAEETIEITALLRNVLDQFRKIIQIEGILPFGVLSELQREQILPGRACDIISSVLRLDFREKLDLLETIETKKRLEILDRILAKEASIAEAKMKIQKEVEKKISKEQREFMLREQLNVIEKELGIVKEEKEYRDLETKIKHAKMPKEVEELALKELSRLRAMPVFSAEAPYIRTYLDWMISVPWGVRTKTEINLDKAKKILDEDHYGLGKAKERVLEYLAVEKLTKGRGRGTILCFVGPPGTGKTSVGKSIARALGRKFVRISLGGIRDEAEIRGHRRTYVGALPGRIIQGMRIAGVKNPVFMMDEIDKIGASFMGDPSAALLEALDSEQNNSFSDHYLEAPFDLSEVIFITTANILDAIPPALRDRMEVIEFPGYADDEKFNIAKKYLIFKIIEATGLDKNKFEISNEAIYRIIGKYTREAGVRNLERKISEIARKVAKKIAEGKIKGKILIKEKDVFDYLGPEEFQITMREAKDEVGIATGLAWTPTGGEIIFIEAAVIPGQGNLILTGQLGEVMQESAKAAMSYIRSRAGQLGIAKDFYKKSDIHIHVPSGAIPKDGPSAGIAIAMALASALTGRKVKKEVALTGEATLSGKVLEIGGVKEKILAAHRAGVEIVVLPKDNEKNLFDIPIEVKKELGFKFVKHIDEILGVALYKK